MKSNRDRIHVLLAIFVFLTVTLLPSMFVRIAVADEPLAFTSTQPPEAFENEDYTWKGMAKGGKTPYSCNVTGSLPPGLLLDSANCVISGKLSKGNTLDKQTFDIKVTDSSSPRLSVTTKFTIPLRYRANINVSSALSEGETNIYVDGQQTAKSPGGQKTSLIFPSGTKHTISVEPLVTVPNNDNIRFRSAIEKVVVDGTSPDANFDYVPEYNIRVKSNIPDIPPLPGSGWYKTDALLDVTALALVEPKPGTQYRFSHWLLPTGEVSGNRTLSWKINKPGDSVATYDTYYQLTVNSEHCAVDGIGWYKAGSKAIWKIKCSESIPAPDFWGSLGVELKPQRDTGTVIMDAPRELEIIWKPDYTRIIVQVTFGVIGAVMFVIIGLLHERIKKLIARIRGQ